MIGPEFSIFLLIGYALQIASGFFWYAPSRLRTLDNCITLKEQDAEYYPNYCDRLIKEYGVAAVATTSEPTPFVTTGWGWGQWGEWMEDSCPADCGRRCRLRRRHCMGPYEQGCRDNGDSYEFDSCESRRTTPQPEQDPDQDEPDFYDDEDGNDANGDGTPFQRFRGANTYRRAGSLATMRVIKRRRKP
ncbi:uncharacterized protein LOC131890603 [Tigriopus californicus]|uniref:uncharacterized protein LOC131890603 n=1 Tax=Tigriopus californicus TaxID=6832 RepID=UPI0027D9F0EE|nr:uncharacterized protein LOC131890603 [Tigriopus californicus]